MQTGIHLYINIQRCFAGPLTPSGPNFSALAMIYLKIYKHTKPLQFSLRGGTQALRKLVVAQFALVSALDHFFRLNKEHDIKMIVHRRL